MIRRLYVDNFRSLVDFTWEPGKETLVLGYNGSGKTSALDALEIVRNWNWGWEHLFTGIGPKNQCRFLNKDGMRFAVTIEVAREVFTYELALRFSPQTGELSYVEEQLESSFGGIFRREGQELAFTVEHPEASPLMQNSAVPMRQSAASLMHAYREAAFVRRFMDALSSIINVRPIPPTIRVQADRPEDRPSRSFENFVAWYWNQTASGAYQRAMLGSLDDVWEEFDYLKLNQAGRTMLFGAVFKQPQEAPGEIAFDFDELSDGERMLIVLYSLVAYQKSQLPTTIIIDEPDNFVSILEIQPWLLRMLDTCPDDGQLILISHNEEIIQTMGRENVAYFSRKDHLSPTTVRNVKAEETDIAPLRDLLRRGWLDE